MAKRKQIPVNLNLDDPREEEMFNWYFNRTSNLSGFVKDIMYEYMGKIRELERDEKQLQLIQTNKDIKVNVDVQQSQPQPEKRKRRLGSIPGAD